MGAAATIEQGKVLPPGVTLASRSVNAGVDFITAYTALQAKVKKTKSSTEQLVGPPSIHALALRQLSQKLKNQETLERNRRKVLKSRSVPFNIGKGEQIERSQSTLPRHGDDHEDFDHEDLEVIHDQDFALTPPRPNRLSAAAARSAHHAVTTHAHVSTTADVAPSEVEVPNESATKKPPKKKPALFLQVNSEHFSADTDPAQAHDDHSHNEHGSQEHRDAKQEQQSALASADSRISPNGTLYMGKVRVLETGIVSDAGNSSGAGKGNLYNFEDIKRNYRQDRGYVAEEDGAGRKSWRIHRNESGRVIAHGHEDEEEDDEGTPLPAMSKKDFIEIATLGSGASGVVSEAIHVPSLTIVALKMLPVYNHEKRLHVSRELNVLYKNLTEMRLIDDRLSHEDEEQAVNSSNSGRSRNSGKARCPNVLSLYNAFKDPHSGMINLVVEYMDGGSLEDLVKQGGCQDERVIADIAFQTLNGLAYLHKNKNVHRDIKPANILCSSSGLIKIADFGISKALDKTTGFANSFVGTVSYMSPERITAESYSFPCDIWSLGLTLLAVAKGRFPLSLRSEAKHGEETSEPLVIAGPGGYWAMIKAICDDEPPVAGSHFSPEFNDFIAHTLRKDPAERWSARALMSSSFAEQLVSPQTLQLTGVQLSPQQQQQLRADNSESTSADTSPRDAPSSSSVHNKEGGNGTGSGQRKFLSMLAPGVTGSGSSAGNTPAGGVSKASPLTARLTTVTIAKNNPGTTPKGSHHAQLLQQGGDGGFGVESEKLTSAFSNGSNYAASDDQASRKFSISGLGELDLETLGLDDFESAAIYAIRLEHLGTVLERIARKLQLHAIAEEGEDMSEENPSPSQHMRSHARTPHHHHKSLEDALFATDSSLDSMEERLLFADAKHPADSPHYTANGHNPLQLHLPHRSSASADHKADEKTSPRLQLNLLPVKPSDDLPVTVLRSPRLDDLLLQQQQQQQQLSQSQHQRSILKSSFTAGLEGAMAAATDTVEARRTTFATSSAASHFASSTRSVHFQEENGDEAPKAATGGLRGRLQLKALQLHLEDDEDADAKDVSRDRPPGELPRPSSYFVRSSTTDDATPNSGGPGTSSTVSSSSTSSAAHLAATLAAEYRHVLPKLTDNSGLRKWMHLADQLNLPLQVVLLAARAHLGSVVEDS